ncbi:MAG: FTR1 family protein [Pseudomonadota bacterium]
MSYEPGKAVKAGNAFSALYFDLFEASGLEFRIGAVDKDMLLNIETQFSRIIGLAIGGKPQGELATAWTELKGSLAQAQALLQKLGKDQGFWSSFIQSFIILLREGIEALLVVSALVLYLRRVGAGDQVYAIWWGCGLALVASAAVAYLIASAAAISGLQREIIEGITLLVASAVLFYISCWLFSKREAERWRGYITAQLDKAVSSGSVMALAVAAFLAVFREGAETALFYQALLAGDGTQANAIYLGFAAAAVTLIVLFFAFRTISFKIPLKPFFTATAVILFAMAVIFSGKGILELQVAGLISRTEIAGGPIVSWLGIFPTWESVGVQVVLLLLVVPGWFIGKRPLAPQG